jgi:hypothetical protein
VFQRLASMTYFDFLNNSGIEQEIKDISLIEPSEIALRRAALHISKFNESAVIQTINKDLDSLVNGDFSNNKTVCKLHLLSNILDINLFSLTDLLQLIDSNFSGENYFICVSPYVNDMRTSRLDAFVNHFSKKNNFKKIKSIDNKRGEWICQPITRVWQKWRFSAPQTHLWLIKIWFSASTFVVKIATFAKPENVRRKPLNISIK